MGRLAALHRCCVGLTAIGAALLAPGFTHANPDAAVQVTVTPEVPTTGELVEIRVVVTNVGTEDVVSIVVDDPLPAGVAIPAGMAHFASTGTYYPATGKWYLGPLAPTASATLTVPVTVVGEQPPCIVNVARVTALSDINGANDRASAALRRTPAERCVDLRVAGASLLQEGCGIRTRSRYFLPLYNDGPDDATDAIVDLSQTPILAEGLEFVAAGCAGTRCVLPRLRAGTGMTLEAESADYFLATAGSARFSASISSAETDYASENNQRTDDLVVLASPLCGGSDEVAMPLSGCFIATAAYGSPLEAHVQALRTFRDEVLARSDPGRALIAFYERLSPPVAAVIRRHPALGAVTRAALTPAVFAVENPTGSLVALLSTLLLVFALNRKRQGRAPRRPNLSA